MNECDFIPCFVCFLGVSDFAFFGVTHVVVAVPAADARALFLGDLESKQRFRFALRAPDGPDTRCSFTLDADTGFTGFLPA